MKVKQVMGRDGVERLFGSLRTNEWNDISEMDIDIDSGTPMEDQIQQHFDNVIEDRYADGAQLDVTSVKMKVFNSQESTTLAICSVVINGALTLTGLRLLDGSKGPYVVYPLEMNGRNRPNSDRKSNVFYPTDPDLQERISVAVKNEAMRQGVDL